jgi:hypothetical protein
VKVNLFDRLREDLERVDYYPGLPASSEISAARLRVA